MKGYIQANGHKAWWWNTIQEEWKIEINDMCLVLDQVYFTVWLTVQAVSCFHSSATMISIRLRIEVITDTSLGYLD